MELEKRVEMLEQEIQVLKGQIQATLLDIQEHILTNAYPSLRADNVAPPSDSAGMGDKPSIRSVSLSDLGPSVRAPETEGVDMPHPAMRAASHNGGRESVSDGMPAVRKVTLEDIRSPKAAPAEPRTEREVGSVTPPMPEAADDETASADQAHWATLTRLEEWVRERIQDVGVQRTQQLIRLYAEQGQIPAEVAATLLQFVAIYDSKVPASKRHPAPAQQLRSGSSAQPKTSGSQAARSQNVRTQTLTKPTPQPHPPSLPPIRSEPPLPGPSEKPESAEKNGTSSVVLRLIAGIQNAGAGVRWRKKDG